MQKCILAAILNFSPIKTKTKTFRLYFIHTDKYTVISILYATNETMHIKIWMYSTSSAHLKLHFGGHFEF